jgi:hypothetical protein
METEKEGSHGNLLLSRFGLEATHVAWTDLKLLLRPNPRFLEKTGTFELDFWTIICKYDLPQVFILSSSAPLWQT